MRAMPVQYSSENAMRMHTMPEPIWVKKLSGSPSNSASMGALSETAMSRMTSWMGRLSMTSTMRIITRSTLPPHHAETAP